MRCPAEKSPKKNKTESLKGGVCIVLKKSEKFRSKHSSQKVSNSESNEGGT